MVGDWPSAPELPSKLFNTSAEARRPALQAFLQAAMASNKSSRALLDFIGLEASDSSLKGGVVPVTVFDPASLDIANERISKLVDALLVSVIVATLLLCLALNVDFLFALAFVAFEAGAFFVQVRPLLHRKVVVPVPPAPKAPAQAKGPSAVSLEPLGPPDLSTTPDEAVKLRQLRERLEDFLRPQDEPQWTKTHAEAIGVWKPDLSRIQNAELREHMWNTNVMKDRRLVWFIRGTSNLDEAEYSVRDAMLSRMVFGLDEILTKTERPPEWIVAYAASPVLTKYMQDPNGQRDERIKNWWLRDKDGNLLMYNRSGPAKSQAINDKFRNDEKTMLTVLCWYIEALRADFDKVHDDTQGKVSCQVTLVTDLTDFSLANQLSAGTVLPLARKYVPILAPVYRGVLKRVIVINAPWYINMLMKLITPFVPKEILDCISIHGTYNMDRHLRPFVEDKYIPAYLGGQWPGDHNQHFPPAGPWIFPDRGDSLLL